MDDQNSSEGASTSEPRARARRAAKARIALPPGILLDRLTRFLLTREAHRRFVRPVIADMQSEYAAALAEGDLWHARWIRIRGYFLVVPGYVYGFIVRSLRKIFST